MDTRNFEVSGFKGVMIRFAMEAEIIRGDNYSVSVSGNETLIDNIEVFVEDNRLVLGYNLNLISLFAAPFNRAKARITMPVLNELKIVGAARCSLQGFNSREDFILNLAGAGKIEINDMTAGNVRWSLSGASSVSGQVAAGGNMDIKISGASRVKLAGSAGNLDLEASGASHFEMDDFPVGNARIRLIGASRGVVKLDGRLDVVLEGASNLEYSGRAVIGDVKVTGASSIKKQ
ncbi:MAG: DUF2807 domain-containing protein [Dehalococcoidales bacterium]|nr:DUF2807 domain-containing protein [Dehalococcoidales bacterium]